MDVIEKVSGQKIVHEDTGESRNNKSKSPQRKGVSFQEEVTRVQCKIR